MSSVKMITIKHKQSGFTRKLGEPEFNGMMDKADFEIISERARNAKGQLKADNPDTPKNEAYEDGVGPKPTKKSSTSSIKKYLDAKGIKYNTTHKTKSQLLALINA